MSWLDTVLTVGNSMMLASQVQTLHELNQQQSDMAAIAAVIAILRHQIFRYNQVTKEVLAQQEREPKLALASLKLFQYEMSQAGLKARELPRNSR